MAGAPGELTVAQDIRRLPAVAPVPSVSAYSSSDHSRKRLVDYFSFAQVGIPSMTITDTSPFGYPHYNAAASG